MASQREERLGSISEHRFREHWNDRGVGVVTGVIVRINIDRGLQDGKIAEIDSGTIGTVSKERHREKTDQPLHAESEMIATGIGLEAEAGAEHQ